LSPLSSAPACKGSDSHSWGATPPCFDNQIISAIFEDPVITERFGKLTCNFGKGSLALSHQKANAKGGEDLGEDGVPSAGRLGKSDPRLFSLSSGSGSKEHGDEVAIFLAAEGVVLIRDEVINSLIPLGWPPLKEIFQKVKDYGISIYV
jgi:hypothetical protein